MSPKLLTLPALAIALGVGVVACQSPEVRSPYGENDEVETEQPQNYPEQRGNNADDDDDDSSDLNNTQRDRQDDDD